MKLPSHKPQPIIQAALLFEGMEWPELAGWHMYYREREMRPEMAAIEKAAANLSEDSKRYLRQIKYFQPLNKI